MPCQIVNGPEFTGIHCGSGPRYLPDDFEFPEGEEMPFVNVCKNGKLFQDIINMPQAEAYAEGIPGTWTIEITGMMSTLIYTRVEKDKWELTETKRGMV